MNDVVAFRPLSVWLVCILNWIVITADSLLKIAISNGSSGFISLIIWSFLYYKVFKGKKWARVTSVTCGLLFSLLIFASIHPDYSEATIDSIAIPLGIFIQHVLVGALLFTKSSNRYFNQN